jgi:hypothetical protein
MAISLLGSAFTDELHTDFGAAALSLMDTPETTGHDYFRDLVIRTAAGGGGTLLTVGVDYAVSEENTDLSDKASTALGSTVNVYGKIQIINATYQTGNLYFSGYYHGDSVSSSRTNKEKPRYNSLSADTTIDSTYGCGKFFCNAGANGIRLTLDFEAGQECEFVKTDLYATNKSAVTLIAAAAINGFTAQSGNYYLWLFEQCQRIKIYFDGTTYFITGGWLDYGTGGINTSTWTNRHLGDAVSGYDNVISAFKIGEKVTAASGNTGVVVALDATTLIFKKVTGTGIFVNNEVLTGSFGGSALVNVSTKNIDSYVWHNTGLKHSRFDVNLYYYEGTTFNTLTNRKFGDAAYSNNTVAAFHMGHIQWGVDANNFYLQTASNFLLTLLAAGAIDGIDIEDYSYSIEAKIYF